jgi:hypothetical protein
MGKELRDMELKSEMTIMSFLSKCGSQFRTQGLVARVSDECAMQMQ